MKSYVKLSQGTSHTRLRAHDHYSSSTLIGGKGGAGPSSLHTMLEGRRMQDGCTIYMDSYMASNGSCFMVTWTIFNNHLLDVGLTHVRETMALRTLKTIHFILFHHVWGPAQIEIHWNSIWLRAWLHMASHYTWGSFVTTLRDFGGVLGRPLNTFFWALTISLSHLLARVCSGPH